MKLPKYHWNPNILMVMCPVCRHRMLAPRAEHDYPEATLLVLRCPGCCGGDFDDPAYYDEKGEEVLYDVKDIPKHWAEIHKRIEAKI